MITNQNLSFFILTIIQVFFLVKSKIPDENAADHGIPGSNRMIPLYNSHYRIRVRKSDPTFRTVVIKGIEPKFPYDINADGTLVGSKNPYSELPISLHVPIIPFDKSVKLRRIPVITTHPMRLPLEYNERILSFGVNICNLPSLWYLELTFCVHKGVTKFTTGVLTSYTLQDVVGAALDSMELPSEGFSFSRCITAIGNFSDIAIAPNSKEVCSTVASCLSSKDFMSDKGKQLARRWEKQIVKVYKEMPPFFRGQQPRSYAQKVIAELIMAKRAKLEEYEAVGIVHDLKKIPDKLFVIVRCFNFVMLLTEFLIHSGFKDVDAFEVSPKGYLKICVKSLMQPTPVKMIAKCARMLINAHVKNNSIDYLPFIRKATWSPFSNAIIQHACTELVSIGFINSGTNIPKNMSIDEVKYLAFPHLAHNSTSLTPELTNSSETQPSTPPVTKEARHTRSKTSSVKHVKYANETTCKTKIVSPKTANSTDEVTKGASAASTNSTLEDSPGTIQPEDEINRILADIDID